MPHRVGEDLGQEEPEAAAYWKGGLELLRPVATAVVNGEALLRSASGPFAQPSRERRSVSSLTSTKMRSSERSVSCVVVQMMAQPRIFMAMSRDGLLPPWIGRVHPRFGTPHLTTVATGVVVAIAAGLTPIDVLGHMVSIGTLFAFVVVSAGVLVLRRTHPEQPRPFRKPWSPVVPALSAIV